MTKRPRRPTTSRGDHGQSSPAYDVGYGRPPLHSRFKAGESGYPKGRPKRHRNLRTVVEEAVYRIIKVREGDRTRSVSKLEGVVLTMLNKALQGDAKALTALIALLRSVGMTAESPEPSRTEPVTAHDGDIIADFLRRQGASTKNAAASELAVENPQNFPPGKGMKP